MFDGLLKSKFHCKCKSNIMQVRTRIDFIRKKRNATQKYLRNDVADLLKNGLDTNAYGRVEGLLVEMNQSSHYEFVDQCCEHISKNILAMDKQRFLSFHHCQQSIFHPGECPDDCREAVSSLMFAAARLAHLPELRDLRSLFSQRYGNSLDCFVSKEFTEKMKSDVPSNDSKLRLLQEIATESGLRWDSKALEIKNFAKETNDTGHNMHKQKEASRNYEDRLSLPKKKETAVPPKAYEDKRPPDHVPIPPPYIKSKVDRPNHDREAKPVARSVRKGNLKPEPNEEEKIQRTNKERAAQGQRILKFFDDGGLRDEGDEEKTMDKLLRHYSMKNGTSLPDEKGKGTKLLYKTANRVSSLPADLASPPESSKKQYARCTSFQPELLHGNGHVHPKLPDYEDFVARLAALRGK
ncbi:hypothetical protein OROGR_004995 [Orobanche gracilis]